MIHIFSSSIWVGARTSRTTNAIGPTKASTTWRAPAAMQTGPGGGSTSAEGLKP